MFPAAHSAHWNAMLGGWDAFALQGIHKRLVGGLGIPQVHGTNKFNNQRTYKQMHP